MYVTIMPMGRKALGNKELELELDIVPLVSS